MPDERPLTIVSNRGPAEFGLDEQGNRVVRRGGGGLVTALTGLVTHRRALWVASAMTDEDVAGPFVAAPLPDDMMELAKLDALGYTSPLEMLAERFHAQPALLTHLNQVTPIAAGQTIAVPNVEPFYPPAVERITSEAARTATDDIMVHIAELLPAEYRGEFSAAVKERQAESRRLDAVETS